MAHYIYSTHTNPVNYVEFDKTDVRKNHNVIKRKFFVAGGHGMCDRHFVTKEGVVTRVDKDEDMEWLMSLDSFQRDIKNGFIRVMKRKEDSDKVVRKDMNPRDGSAPKTPADYKVLDKNTHVYAASGSNV